MPFYHFYMEEFVLTVPVERVTQKDNCYVIYCPFKWVTESTRWEKILNDIIRDYKANMKGDISVSLYYDNIKLMERTPTELISFAGHNRLTVVP